ncbi:MULTISPECIES: peptidylprolyl isomerase [Falsihalocynthiibacter]|uniref:peptidylprolyl isomerase n=1 Tax=Falsihalocynthiibacter TaxID=2854182 RepID=UPI0030010013
MSRIFLTIGRIVKSPLLHFFLIGAAIFATFEAVSDGPEYQAADVITLTPEAAGRLAERFTATRFRPPTPKEMDGLMRSWALEEVYVREALALGLDRGDQVVRQRLNLKMQFLAGSGAAVLEPDDATLQAYLDSNPDSFLPPVFIAFDQLLLPNEQPKVIEEIRNRLENGADPATLGSQSLLPGTLAMTPAPVVERTFGTGFYEALAILPVGVWEGPVKSGYGWHLVRITAKSELPVPPLSEIRDRVEAEWRAAKSKELQASFGEALLGRYSINMPRADEVLGQ